MKNKERIIFGLIITAVIYAIAQIVSANFKLNIKLLPDIFVTLTIFWVLSALAIFIFRKHLSYTISLPKLKKVFKPFGMGIVMFFITFVLLSIIMKVAGIELEGHPGFKVMNPLQIFIFVFIYASIAEEILFRGFLLNLLKPLSDKGITFFKRKISLSVIVSAIAFGLAHLVLVRAGVGVFFLIRVVLFATSVGIVAGYYQEKYNNNAYAIIVHMGGNLFGVVAAILLNLIV
jgi:membrane protease YdiL (CAAX protease family)